MELAVCTLYEKTFHLGVAGLINSLDHQGFKGTMYVGYRGELPPWASKAQSCEVSWVNASKMQVSDKVTIIFLPVTIDYHLTNYKPFFMKRLLDEVCISVDGLCYFDPDIVLTRKWEAYEDWVGSGIAMVHEIISNDMPPSHPVRALWGEVIFKAGLKVQKQIYSYINAGFLGVLKTNSGFLDNWIKLIEVGVSDFGLDINLLKQKNNRYFGTPDQDAFNIAAMCSELPLSELGPYGMGFIPGRVYMAHAVGQPKPWDANYIKLALSGNSPKIADKKFWQMAGGPIRIKSNNALRLKHLTIKIASFVGRFYAKNSY